MPAAAMPVGASGEDVRDLGRTAGAGTPPPGNGTPATGAAGSVPPAALGLRERKRLETFYGIQSAARRLVAERGLDQVTAEEIAATANVSTRTFFNYFHSKHAAVVDPPPRYREMMAAGLAAQPATLSPLRAFQAATIQMFLPQARDQQQLSALMRENPALDSRYRAGLATYEQIIIDWVADRTSTDPAVSAYPRLVAATVNAAVHLIVDRWRPETGVDGLLAIQAEVFDLLENGLTPPGGAAVAAHRPTASSPGPR